MRDTELYRHLLGLETPWKVGRVELSATDGRVDIWVAHPARTRFACPDCKGELSVYDHSEERAWRHLDSCAFLTYLHCHPPRVDCPEHGVRQVGLPWAEPHSRFTTLFERLAIDVLAACDVASAARLLRVSWDQAWHLMDRAVARDLAAKPLNVPAHVGVDEKFHALTIETSLLSGFGSLFLDFATVELLGENQYRCGLPRSGKRVDRHRVLE
jgi:transposase